MSKAVKLTSETIFNLPASVTGAIDVSRLLREIEAVDYDFEAQKIRDPQAQLVVPPISRRMSEVAGANGLSIESAKDRRMMIDSLRKAKEKSPTIHLTFASEPDPSTLTQLVQWVRENLHPMALVATGIQPNLVGGCVVRTPDHIYDYSFRTHLQSAQPMLIERLKAL